MAERTPQPSTPEPAPEAGRTFRARLAGAVSWRWAALAAALAVAAGLAAGWTIWSVRQAAWRRLTLEQALHKLDAGDREAARRIAALLRYGGLASYDELGGAAYVLGVAAAQEADEHWSPSERRAWWLIAARYLEEARDRGFPAGRRAHGLALLGAALHHAGRYGQAIPVLGEALREPSDEKARRQLLLLLAQAYLRDTVPQPSRALAALRQRLADPNLSEAERWETRLEEARVHVHLGDLDAARAALAEIPDRAPIRSEAILLEGLILVREADRLLAQSEGGAAAADGLRGLAKQKYAAARTRFRLAQGRDRAANQTSRKAMYWIGVVLRRLGDLEAAQAQLRRTRKLFYDSPEAVAALLEEADVLRELGRADEAVAAYRQAVREAGDPAAYANPWVSRDAFRRRLRAAYDGWFAGEGRRHAVELARGLWPMFARDEAARLEAAALDAWADQLAAAAAAAPPADRERLAAEARRRRRAAGAAYERLARWWLTRREYPTALWAGAQSYFQGRNYRRAAHLLEQYLENEARRRRPAALALLGRCRLALGDLDGALEALTTCVEEHAKDPASYQARLTASWAYWEQGRLDAAKRMVVENLYETALTPRSIEWRESLFQLGRLLYEEGLGLALEGRRLAASGGEQADQAAEVMERSQQALADAARTLNEAVLRYPDDPQAVEARYLIAEAHRRAAAWPRARRQAAVLETTRMALTRQMRGELTAALEQYDRLLDELQRLAAAGPLDKTARLILRNCRFARADVLFDLDRYEDAASAYAAAAARYYDQPEALEAFVRLAGCFSRLGRPGDARGALAQARAAWERTPADAPFQDTTRADRDHWRRLLDWLITM